MTIKVVIRVSKINEKGYAIRAGSDTFDRFEGLKAQLESEGYRVVLHLSRQYRPPGPRRVVKNRKLCSRCKRQLKHEDRHRERINSGQTYRRGICNACWRRGWRFDENGEMVRKVNK